MSKKTYILLSATILVLVLYTFDAQAACCGGVCRAGGYCEGDEWYVGCKYIKDSDERIAKSYDVFPDGCLVCECSSSTSCSWTDKRTDITCPKIPPKCYTCSYDDINLPSFSSCSAVSDCAIKGVCYQAAQQSEGSCCCGTGYCGTNQVDDDYSTNCPQNGRRVGEICYYGSQINTCTSGGWTCQEDNFFNCTTLTDRNPDDNILKSSEPTVDTCTSICNNEGVESCCDVDTVTCDDNCVDNFCVTATGCESGPFTINYGGRR